jgi:hypothetical protein
VPALHALHVRSLLALPRVETNVPAEQTDHALQAVASLLVLKVPAAQGAHDWSRVAVSIASTNSPGAQECTATHALAGLPS